MRHAVLIPQEYTFLWYEKGENGKNLIYHLLNKNFMKYVKLLLYNKRVNETVNLMLPYQTRPPSKPIFSFWVLKKGGHILHFAIQGGGSSQEERVKNIVKYLFSYDKGW